MFIGQQFLQNVLGYSTLEAGAADPPGRRLHGARRAALGEARRGARRPLHAAHRLRLLPARLPHDAAALEGGHRRTGRSASATRSSAIGVGLRGHARVALAHRIGAGDARRAWRRAPPTSSATSAARSCSRSSARCSPRATRRRRRRRSPAPRTRRRSPTASQSRAHEVVLEREPTAAAVPAVREPDHRRAPSRRSSTASTGPTPPASSPSLLGAALVFFMFPKHDDEMQLLATYRLLEDTAPAVVLGLRGGRLRRRAPSGSSSPSSSPQSIRASSGSSSIELARLDPRKSHAHDDERVDSLVRRRSSARRARRARRRTRRGRAARGDARPSRRPRRRRRSSP